MIMSDETKRDVIDRVIMKELEKEKNLPNYENDIVGKITPLSKGLDSIESLIKENEKKNKERELEFEMKDSGERRVFETGAIRDTTTGKGRFDLISPIALKRLAVVLELGAAKYNFRNWEVGIPLSSFIDSAERHLNDYKEGKRDEDHMGQCLWNIHSFIHTEEMIRRGLLPETLNDLPESYISKEEI